MELTTEVVSRFEGGQLETQNRKENYLYRGEIERAWVEDNTLHVRFKWFAKMGEDYLWHAEENLDYSASLKILSASEIGEGRIHYSIWIVGENGTFFPPNGSKLDPSKVIGLKLTEVQTRCRVCGGNDLTYATSDPLSDAQMSCKICGFEGLWSDFDHVL